MFAKLTAHNNNAYKAAVFDPKTRQWQFIRLEQCPFRDHAEAALKRQIPDVRIAHDDAELAQWLTELAEKDEEPAKITPERMDKFTWHVGDLAPVKKAKKDEDK